MKASEHIKAVQALIDKHGDLPMHIWNDEWGVSDEMRSVTHEAATPEYCADTIAATITAKPECFVVN